MLNQQIIKQNNMRKLFLLIWENEPVSRITLSKMASLSKTTVSTLVDELISKGYVLDLGSIDTGKQGRKPSSLCVNKRDNVLAVINWRPFELEISLVNIKGDIVYYNCVDFCKECDYLLYIREAFDSVIEHKLNGLRLLAVCLVVPSLLNSTKEEMVTTTLPITSKTNTIERLKQLFWDVPFAIFNDTACYAYAEYKFANADYDTFHFININDGVGAVIVSDGVMLQGQDGMRPQFGHVSINRNGRKCVCGNYGCLEKEIGEAVLLRRTEELNLLDKLLVNNRITFSSLGKQADNGISEARVFVEFLASDLAYALKNLLTMYYSKHIVIGGTGQELGMYYLNRLGKEMKSFGFMPFLKDVELHYAEVSGHSILRGAAVYFIDKYYDFFESMDNFFVIE